MSKNRIAIIGAGAAGLFAAAVVKKDENNEITVFEKNQFAGKKLLITGKGRCNVTNACDTAELFKNIPVNSRFMYSSINSFSNFDTIDFFETLGVKLKVERGQRVFPVSDKAKEIRDALYKKAKDNGVHFIYEPVKAIKKDEELFEVKTDEKIHKFEKVIIATGGTSYPLTGSTGDGYRFALSFGHTIVKPTPSLVPVVCKESWCRELMGLSLKNVGIKVLDNESQKILYDDFGEMIFTHFGVSGPIVLSSTSFVRNMTASHGKMSLVIDLKPALSEEQLSKRILSDFEDSKNKDFINSLSLLLPSKLIPVIVKLSSISPRKKVNEITRDERLRLVSLLKRLTLTVMDTRPISEAIVTSGGVSTTEINPKTMESKKAKGLFFAGEVIDVDAYTGGFNLQIAFSTARAAINSALI